jgi:hypothetical protein
VKELEVDLDLLHQARTKAQKLVAGLETKFAEIEASPPKDLEPAKLAMGRVAMINAIESAKRSLKALEEAIEIAERDLS